MERASQQLEALYQQESLQVSDQGYLYRDANGNGLQDADEDVPVPRTFDALNQHVMELAGQLYQVKMREARERLDALHQFTTSIQTDVAWMSTLQEVKHYGNQIFEAKPGGWAMDGSGLHYGPVVSNGSSQPDITYHRELLQHIQSSLSHEAWQEVTGYDAVSLVGGAQNAFSQDAKWVEIDKNRDLTESWKALGFSESPPAPYTNWNSYTFLGKRMTLSQSLEATEPFDIFWPKTNLPPSEWRLSGLNYSKNTGEWFYGWFNLDRSLDDANYYYSRYQAWLSSSPWIASQYYDSYEYAMRYFYQNCYKYSCQTDRNQLAADFASQNRFNRAYYFLDANDGFDSTQFLYRTTDLPEDALPTDWLEILRDRLIDAPSSKAPGYRMVSKSWNGNGVRVYPVVELHSYFGERIQDFTVQNEFFSVEGSYTNANQAIQLDSLPPEDSEDHVVAIPRDFLTNPQLELKAGWNYLPPSSGLASQWAAAVTPEAYFGTGRLWPEPIVLTVWQQQAGQWRVWEQGIAEPQMQTQLTRINRWWGTQLGVLQTLDANQGLWIQTSPHLETGNLRWVWSVDPPEDQNFLYLTQWQLTEDTQSLQLEIQTGWNHVATLPAGMPSFEDWLQLSAWQGRHFLVFQQQDGEWKVWVSPDSLPAWHQAYPSTLTDLQANTEFWILMLDELPNPDAESLPAVSLSVDFSANNPAPDRNGFDHDPLPRLGYESASNLMAFGGALVRANASLPEDSTATSSTTSSRQLNSHEQLRERGQLNRHSRDRGHEQQKHGVSEQVPGWEPQSVITEQFRSVRPSQVVPHKAPRQQSDLQRRDATSRNAARSSGEAIPTKTELSRALQETAEIQFSSERARPLREKATELQTPLALYQYVRNRYEFLPYYGARNHSANTFFSAGGNDIDLATLLIAMLRSQSIPARYGTAPIQISQEDLARWTGLEVPGEAADWLATLDHNVVATSEYTTFRDHVWVEAFVPKHTSAGEHTLIDCYDTPIHCEWVNLDPSFKFKTPPAPPLDLLEELSFDYTAYYHAYQNQDETRMHKSPLQVYEDQIQSHLDQHYPGLTLRDLQPDASFQTETLFQLPTALPYPLLGDPFHYDSIEEHDEYARQLNWTDEIWSQYLDITISKATLAGEADPTFPLFTKHPVRLSDLSLDTVRLDFETCGSGCVKASLQQGDQTLATQTYAHGELQWGERIHISLQESKPPSYPEQVRLFHTHVGVVGGQYVLGLGNLTANWQQVQWAVDQLQATQAVWNVQTNAQGALFLDGNQNEQHETDEPLLQDHPEANQQLVARFLEVANRLYFYQMQGAHQRIGHYHHMPPAHLWFSVLGTVHRVQYLDDVVQAFDPTGLVITVQGLDMGLWHRQKPLETARFEKNNELTGLMGSAYEHRLWEQLTRYVGISAVQGIQQALGQGAELIEVNVAESPDSLNAFYDKTGFLPNFPPEWNGITWDLFGTRPMSWNAPSSVTTATGVSTADASSEVGVDVLQSIVTSQTPESRQALHRSTAGQHAWYQAVSDLQQQLQTRLAQEGDTCQLAAPGVVIGDQTFSGPCTIALQVLHDYYLQQTQTKPHAFFDQNPHALNDHTGFEPDAYRFRASPASPEDHVPYIVQRIRDRSLLEGKSFVLASKRVVGQQGGITVYIEPPGGYIVSNDHFHADGGYIFPGALDSRYHVVSDKPYLPPSVSKFQEESPWDVTFQEDFLPAIRLRPGWNRIPSQYLNRPFAPTVWEGLRHREGVHNYVLMQFQEGTLRGWEMNGGIDNVNAYYGSNLSAIQQVDPNIELWVNLWSDGDVFLPLQGLEGAISYLLLESLTSPEGLNATDYSVTPETFWTQRKQVFELQPGWNALEVFSKVNPADLQSYSLPNFQVARTEIDFNALPTRDGIVFWQYQSDRWASWSPFGPVAGAPSLDTVQTEKTLWVYNQWDWNVRLIETLPVLPQITGIKVIIKMQEYGKDTQYVINPSQDPSHPLSTLYVHSRHGNNAIKYKHFALQAAARKWPKGCGWRDTVFLTPENEVGFLLRTEPHPVFNELSDNIPWTYNLQTFCGDSVWGYRIHVLKAKAYSHGQLIKFRELVNLRNDQGRVDLKIEMDPQPPEALVHWRVELTPENSEIVSFQTSLPANQTWDLSDALPQQDLEGSIGIQWQIDTPNEPLLPQGPSRQLAQQNGTAFLITEGDPVAIIQAEVTAVLEEVLQTTQVANQPLGDQMWVQTERQLLFQYGDLPDLGGTYEIQWDFGDGQFANGNHVSHQYDTPGIYQVTLTLTCNRCSGSIGLYDDTFQVTKQFLVQVTVDPPGPNGEDVFVVPPPPSQTSEGGSGSPGDSLPNTSGIAKVPMGIQKGISEDGLPGWEGDLIRFEDNTATFHVDALGQQQVMEQTVCLHKEATLLQFSYHSTNTHCQASNCRVIFQVRISAPRVPTETYTLYDDSDVAGFHNALQQNETLDISPFAGLCGVNIRFEYQLVGQSENDLFISSIQTSSTNNTQIDIPIRTLTSRDRLVQASFEVPDSLDLEAFSFQFLQASQQFGPYYLNDLILQDDPTAPFRQGALISQQERHQDVLVVRDSENTRKFHVYALFDRYEPTLFQLQAGNQELATLSLNLSRAEGFRGCLRFTDDFIRTGRLDDAARVAAVVQPPDGLPQGFTERGLVLPVMAPLLTRNCGSLEWQLAEGFLSGFSKGLQDDVESLQDLAALLSDPIERASELYHTFQLLLDADVAALINKALQGLLIAKNQAIQWIDSAPATEKAYVTGFVLGYVSEQVATTVISAAVGGLAVRSAILAVQGSQTLVSVLSKAKRFGLRWFGLASMGAGKAAVNGIHDLVAKLKKTPVNPNCATLRLSALDLPCDKKVAEFLEERYGDDDWQERMQVIESLTGKKSGPEVEDMLNQLVQLTARLGSGTADRLSEGAVEGFLRIAKHLDDGNFSTQKLVNDFGDNPSLSEGLEKFRTIDLDIIGQVKQARNLDIYDDLSLVSKLGEYLQLIKNQFQSDVINDEGPFRLIKGYKRDEISVDVNLNGDAINGLAVMKEGDNSFGRKHIFEFIKEEATLTRAQQIINAELVGVSSNQDVFRIIKETLETGKVIAQNILAKNFPNQEGKIKNIEVVLGDKKGTRGSIVTVKIK